MPPISQRFPIPKNEDIFEEMCRDLLRLHWTRPGLEIFGKRGERQSGIDILDIGGQDPLYAAQCKLKEEHKTLPPISIQGEVNQAKTFHPPLGKYGILTTAKVSAEAQRKIREINQAHKSEGLFEVELFTWERICALLQQHAEVADHYYGEITSRLAKKIESQILEVRGGVEHLSARVEANDIDSEINEARECVTLRKFQLATFLLNRIQQLKGHLLSSYQTFRVLSIHGWAAVGEGKRDKAAQYFLNALTHQPTDERGRVNEVIAYFLIGDFSTAHSKAEGIRSVYPASATLAAYWIMTAPRRQPLVDLESALSSVLRSDAEVSLALARRALMELRFELALKYAEASALAAPDWSQPQLILGQINLGRMFCADGDPQSSSEPKVMLGNRAEEALSLAISLAKKELDINAQVEALVVYVDVYRLQNKKAEAVESATTAHNLGPENVRALMALAQVRLDANQIDEGIALLEKAHRINPSADAVFMYGRALLARNRESDVETAIEVLLKVDIEELPPTIRPHIAKLVTQCLITRESWSKLDQYFSTVQSHLEPDLVAAFRGYAAHYQGFSQDAEKHALLSQSLLAKSSSNETKEFLARLFMLIGRPAEALPLFQEVFAAGLPSFDPRQLLDCASRLKRDDLVIETCARLHEMGRMTDWGLIEFEVQYLEKYHLEQAIERLNVFLQINPNHKIAKLRRSIIGVKTNRNDLVLASLAELPDVEELPMEYATGAVHVVKYHGDPDDAVDYAYRLLRLRFHDIEAHQALVLSMMPGDAAPSFPPAAEEVAVGTAVQYQETPRGDLKWVVIENTTQPVAEFEEISASEPLALELLGKQTNDTFVLAKGSMHDREAIIRQILPKYVRRYQDCMVEMQVRFGSASSIESISLGTSEEEMRKGLDTILETVKRRALTIDQARIIYNESPISLHMFGSRFGRCAFEGLVTLAQEDAQAVKCCFGTIEERRHASEALRAAKAVVVDLTALATLQLLGLESLLSTRHFRFILSAGTWAELQEMLLKAKTSSAPGGTLTYNHGRHSLQEHTTQDTQEKIHRDESFLEHIRSTVEIVPVLELAALDPSKRDPFEKICGNYGAESILLASNPDYVLWTDDLIQAQIAANEFGANRVWTQLIIGHLAESGILNAKERAIVSARLIGMGFVATLFDSSAVLEAVRLSEAMVWRRPLKEIIEIFANPKADFRSLLGIFVDFAIKLYREPLPPENRCIVLCALLDALWGNIAARKALLNIRKSMSRLFALNPVGESQFNECFDRWAKLKENSIISAI